MGCFSNGKLWVQLPIPDPQTMAVNSCLSFVKFIEPHTPLLHRWWGSLVALVFSVQELKKHQNRLETLFCPIVRTNVTSSRPDVPLPETLDLWSWLQLPIPLYELVKCQSCMPLPPQDDFSLPHSKLVLFLGNVQMQRKNKGWGLNHNDFYICMTW